MTRSGGSRAGELLSKCQKSGTLGRLEMHQPAKGPWISCRRRVVPAGGARRDPTTGEAAAIGSCFGRTLRPCCRVVGAGRTGLFVIARPRDGAGRSYSSSRIAGLGSVIKNNPLLGSREAGSTILKPEIQGPAGHRKRFSLDGRQVHTCGGDVTQTPSSRVSDRSIGERQNTCTSRTGKPGWTGRLRCHHRPREGRWSARIDLQVRHVWGKPIDPDGDCKIELDATGTEITIVSSSHSPCPERRARPHECTSIAPTGTQGDFDASVHRRGVFHPSGSRDDEGICTVSRRGDSPLAGRSAITSASRSPRIFIDGKPRSYANFELRRRAVLAVSKGLGDQGRLDTPSARASRKRNPRGLQPRRGPAGPAFAPSDRGVRRLSRSRARGDQFRREAPESRT